MDWERLIGLLWLSGLILGLSIGYYIGRGSKERTNDVAMWAGQAYDNGVQDCSRTEEVKAANRKFSVISVVAAHKGTWH